MLTKRVKIVQVNIYKGRYLDALVDFLVSERPDFVTMQEVTTNAFNLYEDKTVSMFDLLCRRLKMHGVFNGDLKLKGDETSVFGNAVFSKYPIVGKNILELKTFRPVTIEELDGVRGNIREKIDRHLLDARIDFWGRTLHVLSWHGAWTAPPQDNDETYRQAQTVFEYLKNIDFKFILGGDLNAVRESKTVQLISSISNNFMNNSKIHGTLNLSVHKIAPMGYLIDYIFASKGTKLNKLSVPQITVSDHLPVIAEVEI